MSHPPDFIAYDGDCPFCSSFVEYSILRNQFNIQLIDIRQSPAVAADLYVRSFDLDKGMVLKYGDKYYYGSDAMHMIAILTSRRSGFFNKLNHLLFSNRRAADILYPVLVAGRRMLLFMLGRKKIKTWVDGGF